MHTRDKCALVLLPLSEVLDQRAASYPSTPYLLAI